MRPSSKLARSHPDDRWLMTYILIDRDALQVATYWFLMEAISKKKVMNQASCNVMYQYLSHCKPMCCLYKHLYVMIVVAKNVTYMA